LISILDPASWPDHLVGQGVCSERSLRFPGRQAFGTLSTLVISSSSFFSRGFGPATKDFSI
jgi:hypothetical protein